MKPSCMTQWHRQAYWDGLGYGAKQYYLHYPDLGVQQGADGEYISFHCYLFHNHL